jgi:Transcription initiation factor TFIIIB, Brf1 subunit/Transcription initiation factor TFIIB
MNCSYCGSNQVRTEHDKGQIVCENCGIVIESTIVDMSQEWRAYDKEDKLKKGGWGHL